MSPRSGNMLVDNQDDLDDQTYKDDPDYCSDCGCNRCQCDDEYEASRED